MFDNNSKYRKFSYSQTGEDLIVDFIFTNILTKVKPHFIDIGAHHPFYFNNTAIFYKKGYSGINIEPDPYLFTEFTKKRKNDLNLNIGISDKISCQNFYIMSVPTMNTFSKKVAHDLVNNHNFSISEVRSVPVDTITNVINKYSGGRFPSFLSLDIEGCEHLVIDTINYQHNYPKVICLETIEFSNNLSAKKNHKIIQYLKDKGYIVFADTHINTIFLKS